MAVRNTPWHVRAPRTRWEGQGKGLCDFDVDRDGGRDRDRFVARSMAFVVLDQGGGLSVGRPTQAKAHFNPLKDRCVASAPDGLEIDIDSVEPDLRITRSPLDEQHATCRNAGHER